MWRKTVGWGIDWTKGKIAFGRVPGSIACALFDVQCKRRGDSHNGTCIVNRAHAKPAGERSAANDGNFEGCGSCCTWRRSLRMCADRQAKHGQTRRRCLPQPVLCSAYSSWNMKHLSAWNVFYLSRLLLTSELIVGICRYQLLFSRLFFNLFSFLLS